MRNQTLRDNYECPECKKKFPDKRGIVKHAWCHSNVKQVQCTVCDKTFADKNHLAIHMRTHTGGKPYHRTLCDKSLSSKLGLEIHIASHSGEKPYQCDQCGKSFTTKQGCRIHADRHNGVIKPRKPYQCPVCDKWIKRKDKLKEHKMVHTGEKPYECNLCENSYKSYNALHTHKFTHSDKKRNFCPFCGKSFSQKSVLNKHILIHTGEKPHKCEYCNKGFSQKPHLQKHTRLSCPLKSLPPGTLVFSCEKCGTNFVDQTKLQKHREQHNKARTAQTDVNGMATSFSYPIALMKPFGVAQNLSNDFVTKNEQSQSKDEKYAKSKATKRDQNDDCSFPSNCNLINATNEVPKATEALLYSSNEHEDVDYDECLNVDNLFPRQEDWMNSTEAFDLRVYKPVQDDNVEKAKQCNDTLEHESTNLWTSTETPTDLSTSSETVKNFKETPTIQNETEILIKRQIQLDEHITNQNNKTETKTAESSETHKEPRFVSDDTDDNDEGDGYDSDKAIDWGSETETVEKLNELTQETGDESENVQNETEYGKSNTNSKELRKNKKGKIKNITIHTERGEPIKEEDNGGRKSSRVVKKLEYKSKAEDSDSDIEKYEGSTDGNTDTDEKPVKRQHENRKKSMSMKKPLLYQCPQCKQFFSYKYHEEELESHQCPYCQAVSTNLVDFRTEIRNKNRKGVFKCTICCKDFPGGMQYVKHAWHHSNIKQHQCNYCDKTFVDKSHMEIHQITHSSVKPYQCAVCGKELRSKCGLDVHTRTHTGEKPYVCVACGEAFKDKCKFQYFIRSM